MTIEEIQAAMVEISETAEAENRSMNEEEIARFDQLEKDLQAAQKTAEIRSRIKVYQNPIVVPNVIHAARKGDAELERAFEHYLRTGVANQDIVELREQSTSSTAGGYTIPTGFRQKIVERRKAFGGIRSVAEVIETDSGNALTYPTNDDTANVGSLTAENAVVESGADLVFGQVSLDAYKVTSAGAGSNLPLRVPVELLQDSAFDVAGFVGRKLGERIARKEAAYFATGTGSNEPKGLMTTSSDESDAGTTLTYAKLNALKHDVDPAYRDNAVWVFADAVAESLEGLTDTTGRPLLVANSAAGLAGRVQASSLLGYPVVIDQQTIYTASGNNYVAFGDIREGFIIRDVKDITVVVNPYTRASYGQVEYHAFSRIDSDIQNRNAFATLKYASP